MSECEGLGLPPGWSASPLGEIAGINPPLDRCVVSDDTEVTFVPMRAVAAEGGGLVAPETRRYGEVKKGYTSFLSSDVIMAKITPCTENGKTTVVPEVPGQVCFGSTEFHTIRPEQGVQAEWIEKFLLQHETRRLAQRSMTGGVGQMRVPGEFLNSVRIPIAPSIEQARIVSTLEELFSDLDSGTTALEKARDKLKLYRASILKAAVEGALTADWRARHPQVEPASELLERILVERRRRWEKDQLRQFEEKDNVPRKNWKAKYKEPATPDTTGLPRLPEGWCWATVDQCSSLIQYGSSARADGNSSGVPVLRMGNITADGGLLLDDLKYLPSEHEEFPGLLLEPGDLLFNRTNSAELVGKTAVYSGKPSRCSFASYLIRVRLLGGVDPAIVVFALNGGFGRTWIMRVVNQTVGQANVNGTKLAAFAFPLPPAAEQRTIVDVVGVQLSVISHLEVEFDAKLKAARGLRQSILKQAFSGKLVPQDSNDEPASDLLKRIAAEREAREREAQSAKRKKPVSRRRRR